MDPIDQIKRRVQRAAERVIEELRVSHGIEHVSISMKDTPKSITVTIREDSAWLNDFDINDDPPGTHEADDEEVVEDDDSETE